MDDQAAARCRVASLLSSSRIGSFDSVPLGHAFQSPRQARAPNVRDVSHARGLLRSIVLEPLSSRIDWASLELLDGTFIDPRLAARQTDLLYSVRIDGREALLFVLLEHQSSSDKWMPLRMYTYLGRIWERYAEHNQNAERLPPVLPIVLHHSERGWSAPTSLRALIDADDELAKLLGSALPELQFRLVDLTHIDDATIKLWLTTDLSRLVALCLKHAPYEADLRPRLYEWVDLFGAVVRSPSGTAALAAVTRYLLEVNEIAAPVILDV
jgi:hypothetical protein